jgi:hypothetical protein
MTPHKSFRYLCVLWAAGNARAGQVVHPRISKSSISCMGSRKNSVGIVTRLHTGQRNRDLIPGRGKSFVSAPQRPDCLWGPVNFLSDGYRGICLHAAECDWAMRQLYHNFIYYASNICVCVFGECKSMYCLFWAYVHITFLSSSVAIFIHIKQHQSVCHIRCDVNKYM